MPLVRSSELESFTVNQLAPPNDTALPYLPDAAHVVPLTVPMFPLPDESATVAPEPSSKAYAATKDGRRTLPTVTETSLVVLLPAASLAMAWTVCKPLMMPNVFHRFV